MGKIGKINDQLASLYDDLSSLFSDPDTLTFADVHQHMERLERIANTKAAIDAAFAYICERDNAGRSVGSRYPTAYLTEKLGISRSEAYSRLSRGRKLYAPPEPAPDNPDTNDQPDRDKQEKKDRRRAQDRAGEISAEKQRIIDRELEALLPGASPNRAKLLADALEAAAERSPEDLRRWVRRRVEQANARAPKPDRPKDPRGPYRNRSARIGTQRTDGSCDITITAPAGEAALIKALLDAGLRPGSNLPEDQADKDSRTPAQRRFDQLAAIFNHYESTRPSAGHAGSAQGAASVVVSITLDDLAEADYTTRFSTNTGIDINCYDLLRLGLSGSDFIVQFDRATGMPLSIGRTRLANLPQRLVLLAAQGVCAWEGCTTPFSELEIHHLLPYAGGGPTDIENLIGLCRQHHRCNNDNRDFSGGLRHAQRDPRSGRVGVAHPDGTIHFNTTDDATHAPGMRLRHRAPRYPQPAGGDPPLFAVPP